MPGKRGVEDSSKIFFLFPNKKICCDLSLEPSHVNSSRDSSNEGSQHIIGGEIQINCLTKPSFVWARLFKTNDVIS